MNEELKKHVTTGAVEITPKYSNGIGDDYITGIKVGEWDVCGVWMDAGLDADLEGKANTELIAEAFTVFAETGLTPKEMWGLLADAIDAMPFGDPLAEKISKALNLSNKK